jgi:hypothetical protein
VALIALAVSVLLTAALAVVFWHFYHTLDRRISAILADSVSSSSRYVMPEDIKTVYTMVVPPAEMDVTGAWAAEQERRGIEVTDEEMAEQRRMWSAEGVN